MKTFILAVLISITGGKHLLVEVHEDQDGDTGSDYAKQKPLGSSTVSNCKGAEEHTPCRPVCKGLNPEFCKPENFECRDSFCQEKAKPKGVPSCEGQEDGTPCEFKGPICMAAWCGYAGYECKDQVCLEKEGSRDLWFSRFFPK